MFCTNDSHIFLSNPTFFVCSESSALKFFLMYKQQMTGRTKIPFCSIFVPVLPFLIYYSDFFSRLLCFFFIPFSIARKRRQQQTLTYLYLDKTQIIFIFYYSLGKRKNYSPLLVFMFLAFFLFCHCEGLSFVFLLKSHLRLSSYNEKAAYCSKSVLWFPSHAPLVFHGSSPFVRAGVCGCPASFGGGKAPFFQRKVKGAASFCGGRYLFPLPRPFSLFPRAIPGWWWFGPSFHPNPPGLGRSVDIENFAISLIQAQVFQQNKGIIDLMHAKGFASDFHPKLVVKVVVLVPSSEFCYSFLNNLQA
eukprot:gene6972-4936_t